jgi:hypothetical protein
MPQSPVTSEIHEALDVHGDLGAQIALDFVVRVDDLPNVIHLCIRQIVGLGVPTDAGLIENLPGRGAPNTINVRQGNLDALILG